MPIVFFREGSDIFHRSEECTQLVKKPARGEPHPVRSADLAVLIRVRPCHTCYPDAPRVKVAKRRCPICNKKTVRACPHNGGMPVRIEKRTSYVSLLRDPGDVVYQTIYVWPDRLHLYEVSP